MEKIMIEGTDKSPTIYFDHEKGIIEMGGRSLIEDSERYYLPLVEWIMKYIENPKPITTANLKFEYFNTSCSKWLITIAKQLKRLHENDKVITINWYYEDDDVLEYGEVIRDLVDMPMNMIQSGNTITR